MAKDTIVLIGVTDTIKALKAFDKDAVKSFNKVINSELRVAKKMHKDLFKQNHHLVDGVRNLRSSHAPEVVLAGLHGTRALLEKESHPQNQRVK
jgi:hypothetical protein